MMPMLNHSIEDRPSVPVTDIISLIRRMTGRTVKLQPLYDGVESLAYAYEFDGVKKVVRVNKSRYGFDKDAFAHRQFTSPDIPVPKIEDIIEHDGIFYCFSSFLPGEPESTAIGALEPEITTIKSIEKTLAGIHASDITAYHGYGLWGQTGKAENTSWREYLQTALNDRTSLIQYFKHDTQNVASISMIFDHYHRMIDYCPEERQLVHGDFLGGNLLIQDTRVMAVLDWKWSLYGDPLFDLGVASFVPSGLISSLLERTAQHETIQHLDERLLCYQLHSGIKSIDHGIRARRHRWVEIATQISLGHIDRYLQKSHPKS